MNGMLLAVAALVCASGDWYRPALYPYCDHAAGAGWAAGLRASASTIPSSTGWMSSATPCPSITRSGGRVSVRIPAGDLRILQLKAR